MVGSLPPKLITHMLGLFFLLRGVCERVSEYNGRLWPGAPARAPVRDHNLRERMMTTLRVSAEMYRLFPEAVLGIVTFRAIHNVGESADLMAALREAEAQTVQRFAETAINDHPQIAPWREAYRKFGAKPKDYPSSVENLVRRVAKVNYSIF
jgi:hypothetical protein